MTEEKIHSAMEKHEKLYGVKRNCSTDCGEIKKIKRHNTVLLVMLIVLFVINILVDGALFFKILVQDQNLNFLTTRVNIQRGEIDVLQSLQMGKK